MKNALIKLSNWKFILPLFIAFLIFPVVLFPHFQNRMAENARQEIVPLDSRFSYTYNETKSSFDKLGSDGRSTYRFVIAKVDMAFPLIYGPLFILVLAWLLKNTAGRNSPWVLFALFPLIGVLFEYLENFNTLSLLDHYPEITEEGVAWGSNMTQLKQIFLITSVLSMLPLLLVFLIKVFTRRKERHLS